MATSSIDSLPLLRNGEEYLSQSKKTLYGITGEKLLDVSIAPEMHIHLALKINKGAGFALLQNTAIDDLIDIFEEAGKIFVNDMLINGISTSLDEWAELIARSTGMPITFVSNSLNYIPQLFRKRPLQRVLRANSPTGSLAIYDDLVDIRGTTRFAWGPAGRNCGVSLPGNHPLVSLLGTLIPLFKIPTILRASSSEPFTSFRLAKSLWEAGLPSEALFHLVCDHATNDALIRNSDLALVFGNAWILKAYEDNTRIKTYGPGKSKVLIDIDNMTSALLEHSLDIAYNSIAWDGGRGCINASGIVYNSKTGYEEFRDRLAERFASLEILDPLNPKAVVPAMQPDQARGLYKFIQSRMNGKINDITAKFREHKEMLLVKDELAYFLPTLLELDEENEMRCDEYPFIFGTITRPEDYHPEELVEDSLSVSYLTDNPKRTKRLLGDPSIKKVFTNEASVHMDVSAPHENFLGDFLFRSKATNFDGVNNFLK